VIWGIESLETGASRVANGAAFDQFKQVDSHLAWQTMT
jgi:hypothetical protein